MKIRAGGIVPLSTLVFLAFALISPGSSSANQMGQKMVLSAADTQVMPANQKAGSYSKPTSQQIRLKTFEVNRTSLEKLAIHPVALPSSLSSKNRWAIKRVVRDIRRGNQADAMRQWEEVVREMAKGGVNQALAADIHRLVQFILRESYREQMEDLKFYAEKVRYFNKVKALVRNHIKEMRNTLAKMDNRTAKEVRVLTCLPTRYGYLTSDSLRLATAQVQMTKAELALSIKELEEMINWFHDEINRTNDEMRAICEALNQLMNTIKNILEKTFDTQLRIMNATTVR